MENGNKQSQEEKLKTLLQPVYTNQKQLFIVFFLVSSVGILGAFNVFAYQFLGATPDDYYCKVPQLERAGWTEDQIKEIAIPHKFSNDTIEYSHCTVKTYNYGMLSNMSFKDVENWVVEHPTVYKAKCQHRTFDPSYNTFSTKFDLVCGDSYLQSTAQSAIQSGIIIDSYLLGSLSDRFGRRRIFLLSFALCILSGLLLTVVPYFSLFIILRMCLSSFSLAATNAGLVLCLEMCSIRKRSMVGPYFSLPWAFGIMILPLIAYYVRNWIYLQLIITAPFIIIFLIACFSKSLPESPRWLIINNKHEEAYKAIKRTAANQRDLPPKDEMLAQMYSMPNSGDEQPSFWKSLYNELKQTLSLFIEKRYRVRTLCIQLTWFSASLVYYGVGLGASTINANEYLFIFFGGLVEFISLLVLYPVTLYFGRKMTLFAYFFVSALSILLVFALQIMVAETSLVGLKVVLYLAGKFSIAAAFQMVWVYTGELFPTNLRCLSCGLGSTIAKIGSFISPYINDQLGKEIQWAPAATFGGFSFISAVVILFLPETSKDYLPEEMNSEDDSGTDREDLSTKSNSQNFEN